MDNRVYKLSASTGEINGHVVTGVYPHDVKVSKDGQRLYNSSLGPLGSLPRSASAAPLAEKPGDPFQLTIADVETLAVRDRIKLDNAFRPWQFSKDEKLIYAQLLERARGRRVRSREPQSDPSSRSAGEAGRDVSRLGLRSAASRSGADGGRRDAVPRGPSLGLCRAWLARRI